MLSEWLRQLRQLVQAVDLDHLPPTAPSSTADGCAAPEPDATDLESLKTQPSGLSLPVPSQSPQMSEAGMKDVLQAKTLRALHEAIELHSRAMNGSGIVTNFVVIAETVDANLDNETDKRSLNLLTSADMTAWSLVGFSAALQQAVYSGSI